MLRVIDLAKELDQNSLYSDSSLSKSAIAKATAVARASVYKWTEIAWRTSLDFRLDYPRTSDGKIDPETSILTPYQIWVLSRVQYLMRRLRTRKATEDYMSNNESVFSKARFLAINEILEASKVKAS